MKKLSTQIKNTTESFRLLIAIVLVGLCILVKTSHGPSAIDIRSSDGAEHLATELPIATQAEPNPRKSFPGALGQALTFGFQIETHHVTVLTWQDIDREKLRLLGAVLSIPKEFFNTHAALAGCDQLSYSRGQCRFDVDFASGSPVVIGGPNALLHDYKTSDASQDLPVHL